jgi:mono/diheme cytochrome c family protein
MLMDAENRRSPRRGLHALGRALLLGAGLGCNAAGEPQPMPSGSLSEPRQGIGARPEAPTTVAGSSAVRMPTAGADASPPSAGPAGAASSLAATGAVAGPAVTYQRDIRPLLEQSCVECHGGAESDRIAPFGLSDWDTVRQAVLDWDVVGAVDTGRMPPWMPAAGCRPLADDRSMPPEQRALFVAWREAGYPEGDASDYAAKESGRASMVGEPSLVLEVPTPYTPRVDDEYTCFGLGGEDGSLYTFADTRYLTAIQVLPGEPSEVHHVQVHRTGAAPVAGPTDCSGFVGGSEENMFSWRPGSTPLVFPAGSAARISAGNGMLVQIHYNASFAKNGRQPDQTRVALWFMPEGQPEALITRVQVFGPVNIPAGASDVVSNGSATLEAPGEIVGVTPHAHMLATQMSATATVAGQQECLIDIPKWDFHWQGDYLFQEPLPITTRTQVRTTCVWDNTAANQPLVNQMQLQPRNVAFGEGSFEEMCLHYLWLRRPFNQ